MRLMMFEKGRGAALGLVEGKSVVDLAAIETSLPKDLKSLITAGPSALADVKAAAAKAPEAAKLGLDRVKAALPIPLQSGDVGVALQISWQGGSSAVRAGARSSSRSPGCATTATCSARPGRPCCPPG